MQNEPRGAITTINWKRVSPFLLLAYLTLAIPTSVDIWNTHQEMQLDIYSKVMLSFVILGVACPLFSFNALALFCRVKHALEKQSLLEFVFPSDCTWPDLHGICAPREKVFFPRFRGFLHTTVLCVSLMFTVILPLLYFLELSSWLLR